MLVPGFPQTKDNFPKNTDSPKNAKFTSSDFDGHFGEAALVPNLLIDFLLRPGHNSINVLDISLDT